MKTGIDTNKRK